MSRTVRVLVVMMLAVLVATGCGSKSSSAPTSPSASASATGAVSDSGDAPADPPESGTDAAGVDSSCPTSNTTAFAKTKFVLHAGLAFGAFHRYLYKPYKAGSFTKGTKGRVLAFVKGGLAALFIKREVRLASEDVKANPTLCKAIAAPLAAVGNQAKAALDKLKGGDTSGVESLNSSISSVESTSAKQGDTITEDENADINSVPK